MGIELKEMNLKIDHLIKSLVQYHDKHTVLSKIATNYDNALTVLETLIKDRESVDKKLRDFLKEIDEIENEYVKDLLSIPKNIILGILDATLFNSYIERGKNRLKEIATLEGKSTFDKTSFKISYQNTIQSITMTLGIDFTALTFTLTQMSSIYEAFERGSTPLKTVSEFIASSNKYFANPLTFDWMTSAIYLSALDIIVNEKCQKYGIPLFKQDGKTRRSFKNKFNDLIKKTNVGELEKLLQKPFSNLRAKVLHHGHNPNSSEVKIVIAGVENLVKTLAQI